jgi:hypothetical protein
MTDRKDHPEDEIFHHLSRGGIDDLDLGADVRQMLEPLKDVPQRDEDVVAASRQIFLAQARSMPKPVSSEPKPRRIGWNVFTRKERSPMLTLARLALVLAIMFGGTTATAYAAQESMPSDALYPVKLFTEDVRLALTNDPQASFDLNLDFANRRADEIASTAGEGVPVSSRVTLRLQEHLEQALQAAAQLDEGAMVQAMQQLQTMTQLQTQTMLQSQQGKAEHENEALQQARQTMNQVQNTVQGALEDPITFRQRQGESRPEDAPEQPNNEPSSGEGAGPHGGSQKKGGSGTEIEACEDCTPTPEAWGTPGPHGKGNGNVDS